jgi:RNA polymerase sigma-70 factor (ECF subfamily)
MAAPSTLQQRPLTPSTRAGLDFAQVAEKERAGLERLARHLLWDSEEAQDAVQHALFDAYARWDQLTDPAAVGGWLRSIVTHRAISLLRRRRLWRTLAALVRVEPEKVADPPDVEVSRARHLAALGEQLESLSPKQRTAFSLRYLEGCTLDEVAEAMKMNRGTVRVHVQRAVEKLRASGVLQEDDDGQV